MRGLREPQALAATSAKGHIQNTQRKYSLTPRLMRLAKALMANPHGLPREAADRATPASNSPEYIRQLRERLNLVIPCEMVPFTNSDGEASKRGVYHLTADDYKKLAEVLT